MIQQNARGKMQPRQAEWWDALLSGVNVRAACPGWRYSDVSRERNGHKDHWTVPALTDIAWLPLEEAQIVVGLMVDALSERLDADHVDLLTAQIEEQESDGEEDIAGVYAMQDPSKRRLHLDRLERHRVKVDRLIRAYRREMDTVPHPPSMTNGARKRNGRKS